jgi:hypothetical protein
VPKSVTRKFLEIARPSTLFKTQKMVEFEEKNGKPIEEQLLAPLTCLIKKHGYKTCWCVKCLYGITEFTAVSWRKRLHISLPVGAPKNKGRTNRKVERQNV